MMRIVLPLIFLVLFCFSAPAQTQFSIATDASVMRNFSPSQKFWAFGQTIQGNFHFTRKESAYIWLTYFTPGKFSNIFSAAAKDPSYQPSIVTYQIAGRWQPREVSIGWKHYFKGGCDEENTWSLYGLAGFGMMVTPVSNTLNTSFDTSQYSLNSPAVGSFHMRRLTFDAGIGGEFPIGFDVYLYGDVRTWINASDKVCTYLINNSKVPRPLILSIGIRLLIDKGFER